MSDYMANVAWFVETFYPFAVPIVSFVGVYWFMLHHEKSLLLPYIYSTLLVLIVSYAAGTLAILRMSLQTMMVMLTVHLAIAAGFTLVVRRFAGRFRR